MKKISFGKISLSAAGPSKDPDVTKVNDTPEAAGSPKGFGSFGRKEPTASEPIVVEEESKMNEENDEMARVMGFGSFGGKKAKQFDINTVLKDTLETAVERNKDNIGKCQCASLSCNN